MGPALFSQLLGTTFAGLSLAPGLLLTPGATYAVVVERVGTSGSVTLRGGPNTYADGSAIRCLSGACEPAFSTFPAGDLIGFAVTFAPQAVVPEPGTWVLVGVGLAGGAWMARRWGGAGRAPGGA